MGGRLKKIKIKYECGGRGGNLVKICKKGFTFLIGKELLSINK